MIINTLLTILCILIAYFWYQYKKIHYKFEKAGLKYLPGVPIFGNVWKSTFLIKHFIYNLGEVYDAFPDEKYVGFADGMVPVILVRDPELMKTIVIKDFDYFQNRKVLFPVHLDPLLGRSVLQLQDEEWKAMRVTLSPAFTAARLRYMLPALQEVSKNIVNNLKEYSFKDVDLTNFIKIYTSDAIASAAFGFKQVTAGSDESVFYKLGSSIYFTFWRRALLFISTQFPILSETIQIATRLQLLPKKIHDFFRNAVIESVTFRKKHHLSTPDIMDVVMKKLEGRPIDDLAAQVFLSFTASLFSTSSVLKFCFLELALHPEIQKRLHEEIEEHEGTGEMTMQSISEMKYLDCVLNEISRKWSGAIMMDRVCTKAYILPPPREGGKPYSVEPGDMIYNVVNPVHMDPKYHVDPETIDPERFSDENKHNIKQFTFMPFGMGPRGCLGARFATLEMKVLIYYVLLHFKLVKSKKTMDPIQVDPENEIGLGVVGGTWVRLEPRD